MSLRVGIYDHLGWAVAVTASEDHDVVDRRRIDLLEPGVPNMSIHHPGQDGSRDLVETLVARVCGSAERTSAGTLARVVVQRKCPPNWSAIMSV